MGNHHPKQPPVATFTQRLNPQFKLNDVGAFEEANKMGMHCLIYWVSWHLAKSTSKRHADSRCLGERTRCGMDLDENMGWK